MDKPLALYGAGSMGRMASDVLKTVGHDVVLVIDRGAPQLANRPGCADARTLKPEEVPDHLKGSLRVAVSVVTSPYVPIEASLLGLGFTDVVPFYDMAETFRHLHPLSNGWFAPPLTAEDQAQTAQVLARWGDDVSRAHHLQFLAWRRLREEWSFEAAPVSGGDRFFIAELTEALRDDEVFLDGGAYHGTVVESFLHHVAGKFGHIAAIEPDVASRAILTHNLQHALPHDPRITVFDFALAGHSGDARFHGGLGYASQISETGKTDIPLRPLDALDIAPTFIKLHLEGAELAALQGGRETLLANRPLVAATVYHNADGIWRTPHWLMQTLPDYRFLFRAHSWCGTGAVVYAIPNERGG